jgi:multiple sugar transport system substrate-binding protein
MSLPRFVSAAAVVVPVLVLAACGTGAAGPGADSPYGFAVEEQDAGSPITVWVDATREPAVQAFTSAHPDIPVDVETYDGGANGSGTFQTKITAFDQAGSGWPDVVFSTQNNDAAWAAVGPTPFAAPLDQGYFDQEFLDGFTPGALDPTTVDGVVHGLRNDLASVVTWYDQSLFDEFGYEVPTTWEEYEELGERVAREHPGYIVGSVGDPWTPEVYFWGAKAPINTVTGTDGFAADMSDPRTVRMAELLDTLIESGSVVRDSVFDAEFVRKYTGKVLMLPGPIWFSGALFQNADSLDAAEGTIAAGLPLAWDGEEAVTGNVGGGTWFVSRHSRNLDAARTFLEFVTSADEYQVDLAPGLPAYASAAERWLGNQAESGYFAGDFTGNVVTASGQVWDGWGYPRFSQEAVFAKTVTPELAAGRSLVDLLPAWGTALENEAQVNGYTVG